MYLGSDRELGCRWWPRVLAPTAPAPEPVARPRVWRRPAPAVTRHGDANAAVFGAWGAYAWVKGINPDDRAKMLHAMSHLLRREVTTRRDLSAAHPGGLTNEDRWTVAAAFNDLTQRLDGGFLAHLRGHCDDLGRVVRLREAACGLMLGFGEPYRPGGNARATYDLLCARLEEHMDRCDGHERCTLLADAEALLTDARRAA
ncbi:MAG: hypothetical protein ACO1SX_11165 [Actinomycetota bacterium]